MRGPYGSTGVIDDIRADAAGGNKVARAVEDALRIALSMTLQPLMWNGPTSSATSPSSLRYGHVVLHFCISLPHREAIERELEEQLFADLKDSSKTLGGAHIAYWRRVAFNIAWFTCDGILERLMRKHL
jgi:hypothetical protein